LAAAGVQDRLIFKAISSPLRGVAATLRRSTPARSVRWPNKQDVMTDLTILSARAPQMALERLFDEFSQATGHRIARSYGTVGAIAERFRSGEAADCLVASDAALLALDALLVRGSRVNIARAGLAVAIRTGAAMPDISTPDALKAALVAASAISYSDPTAGGSAAAYFAKLLDRLGIAAAVNPRAKLGRNGHHVAELTAAGEADLGISFLSELVAIPGVTIVGPLPPELQNYTTYAAAVAAASAAREPALALVQALTRSAAREHWRSAGLEAIG
jgi:molybdate transport system substrate-binding protein